MQKALFVTEIGKPVTLGTRPTPTPGPGEVLIKVTSTQILPHDAYGRDKGLFIAGRLPFVLGTNIAGTVAIVGPQVTKYSVGQHIYGLGNALALSPNFSGLQEYALLSADGSSIVPEGFTDDQVATLPVNATTSFWALFHSNWLNFPHPAPDTKDKRDLSNEKLVIIGAGSNVGRLAVQFAKLAGIGTIIGVASISREAELKDMGATHVLDRHLDTNTLAAEVAAICGGQEEVTKVYDCVSWTHELAAAMVAEERESMIATLHPAESAVEEIGRLGKGQAKASFVNGSKNNFEGRGEELVFWESLGVWLSEGRLRVPKFRSIEGLDEKLVNEALDSYRDGSLVLQAVVHPSGKVVQCM